MNISEIDPAAAAATLRPDTDEVRLIGAAQRGDKFALDALVRSHSTLVERIARRHHSSGSPEDLEDLIQVGMVGLLEAIKRFEAERGVLAPYAAATVSGTIKRHLRDRGWRLRIPRSLHDASLKVARTSAQLESKLGREPSEQELAEQTGLEIEQVVEARALLGSATPLSLQAPTSDGMPALDEAVGDDDVNYSRADVRMFLNSLQRDLTERDRKIVALRFGLDQTQTEIAGAVGVSQMQVSRVLRRVLDELRDRGERAGPAAEREVAISAG